MFIQVSEMKGLAPGPNVQQGAAAGWGTEHSTSAQTTCQFCQQNSNHQTEKLFKNLHVLHRFQHVWKDHPERLSSSYTTLSWPGETCLLQKMYETARIHFWRGGRGPRQTNRKSDLEGPGPEGRQDSSKSLWPFFEQFLLQPCNISNALGNSSSLKGDACLKMNREILANSLLLHQTTPFQAQLMTTSSTILPGLMSLTKARFC